MKNADTSLYNSAITAENNYITSYILYFVFLLSYSKIIFVKVLKNTLRNGASNREVMGWRNVFRTKNIFILLYAFIEGLSYSVTHVSVDSAVYHLLLSNVAERG